MRDILKSGLLGMTLIITLIYSAPILNRDNNTEIAEVPERLETQKEKEIHIPM